MSHANILRTLILSDPAASALLGGYRIYPVTLPQKHPGGTPQAFPAIRMQAVASERVSSQDGPSGLARPRVQLDFFARTYDEAKTLADTVRAKIDGFRGVVPGSPNVQKIGFVDEREEYDSELLLHRQSADYYVWHEEA